MLLALDARGVLIIRVQINPLDRRASLCKSDEARLSWQERFALTSWAGALFLSMALEWCRNLMRLLTVPLVHFSQITAMAIGLPSFRVITHCLVLPLESSSPSLNV